MSRLVGEQGEQKLGTTFAPSRLERISTWDALEFIRGPPSHASGRSIASNTSSNSLRVSKRNIKREEPCFITNALSYSHDRAHIINAIRSNSTDSIRHKRDVILFLFQRGIVPSTKFSLNDTSNLINLDTRLHAGMDKYAMFAVTCTLDTMNTLSQIVRQTNVTARISEPGYTRDTLSLGDLATTAQYELVILHPKHFLPLDACLTFYPSPNTPKHYQLDSKGLLREAPATDTSPIFPPFQFPGVPHRDGSDNLLNPIFIILAAEIKFRRYQKSPNAEPFKNEKYDELVKKTIELANEIYTLTPRVIEESDEYLMETSDEEEGAVSDYSMESFDKDFGVRDQSVPTGDSTARPAKRGR